MSVDHAVGNPVDLCKSLRVEGAENGAEKAGMGVIIIGTAKSKMSSDNNNSHFRLFSAIFISRRSAQIIQC